MPGDDIVRCSGVSVARGSQVLLPPVDLTVRPGELVVVLGRSGVGKTTLLHAVAGLLQPTSGSVVAPPAALMPQRDGLLPWARAVDNAALPLRLRGIGRAEAQRLAAGELELLGLGDAAGRRTARLSGGMRQRVALARTLLSGRELLLLDEPFAAVDALTRAELHELLLARRGAGRLTAVMVTHDVEEALRLATRCLVLTASEGLVEGPPLAGEPGSRPSRRGGDAIRDALLELIGR